VAITKLGLYNDALRLIGETRLDAATGLTEDRESRYDLDSVYDLGAIDYCLEVVKPKFATKTVALMGAATTGGVTLAYTHTLPSDFIAIVGIYSDTELDQSISRYVQNGATIICDYATIYLRYTHNDVTESDFTPGFARVVSNYMAREVAYKLDPGRLESIDATLQAVTEQVMGTEGEREPGARPAAQSTALTAEWRTIYNGALMILGKDKLPAGDTDHPYRVKCDTSVDEGVANAVMEDTEWLFGQTSVQIEYNPSIEPSWGHNRAFDKPSDLLRISGIWSDPYFQHPLRNYVDEGDVFLASCDVIYLKYVDSDFLSTPSSWPTYFARLVSAKIAQDIAPGIDPKLIDHANEVYENRRDVALSNDAQASPPHIFTEGTWVRSRYSGRS
jgi:hypothetical protein